MSNRYVTRFFIMQGKFTVSHSHWGMPLSTVLLHVCPRMKTHFPHSSDALPVRTGGRQQQAPPGAPSAHHVCQGCHVCQGHHVQSRVVFWPRNILAHSSITHRDTAGIGTGT